MTYWGHFYNFTRSHFTSLSTYWRQRKVKLKRTQLCLVQNLVSFMKYFQGAKKCLGITLFHTNSLSLSQILQNMISVSYIETFLRKIDIFHLFSGSFLKILLLHWTLICPCLSQTLHQPLPSLVRIGCALFPDRLSTVAMPVVQYC